MIVFLNLWVTSQLASSGKTDEEPIGMGEPPKGGGWIFLTPGSKREGTHFFPKIDGGSYPGGYCPLYYLNYFLSKTFFINSY